MADRANAYPTKRFFLEMLVRDISLEDAILDLIDNAIDGLTRTQDVAFVTSPLGVFLGKEDGPSEIEALPKIDIEISEDRFWINDNCGGIDYESAKSEVFRFGYVPKKEQSWLSVYGIGLKRAVFKIGKEIEIESKTVSDGFRVKISADEWVKEETNWTFSIEKQEKAMGSREAGTRITVEELNPEVVTRIREGRIEGRLSEFIGAGYSLLLGRYVNVAVNGERIAPRRLPIGQSRSVRPASYSFEDQDVRVTIIAGLAERVDGRWNIDKAGWYVVCNGRVVVFADKSELTDWGVGLPQFVSKFRGFLGIVFFSSEHGEKLPWTTTKRGLNRESAAYQVARGQMLVKARPVLDFLNRMYPSDDLEEPAEREVAESVTATDVRDIAAKPFPAFRVTRPKGPPITTVSVQYKAKIADIERAKKSLGKRRWSASRIGRHALEYFLKNECPE